MDTRIHASFVRISFSLGIRFLSVSYFVVAYTPSGHYFLSLFMSHPYLTFPTIPYFIRDAPHTMRLSSSSWRVSLMRYFTTYIPYRTFLFVLSVSFLHARVMFSVSLCFTVARISFHLLYEILLYFTIYNMYFP